MERSWTDNDNDCSLCGLCRPLSSRKFDLKWYEVPLRSRQVVAREVFSAHGTSAPGPLSRHIRPLCLAELQGIHNTLVTEKMSLIESAR